ncbi:MAG: DNA-3-methyladenine glycosylase family protein [Burkholderiales bacterium]
MSLRIKRFLQSRYPQHAQVLGRIATVPTLRRRDMPLPEAVVRVVTGQMLSSKAAQSIYERVRLRTAELGLPGAWQLDFESLRSCGLSGSKARTICEFGKQVGADPGALDHWFALSAAELAAQIGAYKGMGAWTASIVALFYVGHEDVFPHADGSIQRALRCLEGKRRLKKLRIDPALAAPYRSYLAMYLWRGLDAGVIA